MAETKNNLPPGWAVVESDGTVVENTSTIAIDPATEIELKHIEQLRTALQSIEQRISEGKIYGLAFAYVGPEGSTAGYGWTGGCDEYAPLALVNIDLLRQQYFYHWQNSVFEPHDDED